MPGTGPGAGRGPLPPPPPSPPPGAGSAGKWRLKRPGGGGERRELKGPRRKAAGGGPGWSGRRWGPTREGPRGDGAAGRAAPRRARPRPLPCAIPSASARPGAPGPLVLCFNSRGEKGEAAGSGVRCDGVRTARVVWRGSALSHFPWRELLCGTSFPPRRPWGSLPSRAPRVRSMAFCRSALK